eukprot:CAMPEP_0183356922 /NCGR_PEP_ID=MMETSP0164_2-20130417/45273_1 /TAXON_ID=221442 /ORGANISM="Coccolithus pelagicus ssp braarudi, Strain PLY182g" /LENGTH=150 /DNA_ID=CAMNT_0025530441 /DNA_START=515 /DNA_END=966 /DNA_ORIENTATION=-
MYESTTIGCWSEHIAEDGGPHATLRNFKDKNIGTEAGRQAQADHGSHSACAQARAQRSRKDAFAPPSNGEGGVSLSDVFDQRVERRGEAGWYEGGAAEEIVYSVNGADCRSPMLTAQGMPALKKSQPASQRVGEDLAERQAVDLAVFREG